MNGFQNNVLSIGELKYHARRLRAKLALEGTAITHSKSLELLAYQFGYKDWNTLCAIARNRLPSFLTTVGTRVRGYYLDQAFEGAVVTSQVVPSFPDRFRLILRFDQPVDVVTFNGLSNLRRQVKCTLDKTGQTLEKTSNGRPHIHLEVRA
ncbi:MAG: glyoxalase superfamily protein [Pseudomonadota bacterium]